MSWVRIWVRTAPIAHCVASAKARGSAAAVTVMLVPPSSGPLVGLSAKVDGAAKKAMGVGVYCCALSDTFIGARTSAGEKQASVPSCGSYDAGVVTMPPSVPLAKRQRASGPPPRWRPATRMKVPPA